MLKTMDHGKGEDGNSAAEEGFGLVLIFFFSFLTNFYWNRVALKVKVTQLCLTLRDPMDWSMEFSRPEYWSGLPFPSPGDLPNPGIEPRSPTLQADSLPAEPQVTSLYNSCFIMLH